MATGTTCLGKSFLFVCHCNTGSDERYVETKTAGDCRDAVNNIFVSGPIGSLTYKESARGSARDHTSHSSSPHTPHTAPPGINIHQLLVLGFMPARDDFEMEFENEAEVLVSGIEAAPGGVRLDPEDEEVSRATLYLDSALTYFISISVGKQPQARPC